MRVVDAEEPARRARATALRWEMGDSTVRSSMTAPPTTEEEGRCQGRVVGVVEDEDVSVNASMSQ